MTKNDLITLFEWMGLKRSIDLDSVKWLGPIVGFICILAILTFAFGVLLTLVSFFLSLLRIPPFDVDTDGSAIRNIGLVLLALLGLPFLVWRSVVLSKQANIAEESLFNQKLKSATEGLSARMELTRDIIVDGSEVILRELEDDLVVRAAAIDQLEGLVQEDVSYAPRIVRILANYIRGNFSCSNVDPTENLNASVVPRMDLQKAVDAIGKVLELAADVDPTFWRLDLKECNFDGVDFSDGFYRAVDFSGSRFEASILNRGNFDGALFFRTLLNYASCTKANFKGVRFDYAVINRPEPGRGGFTVSINLGNLEGATFIAADISALGYLGSVASIAKTLGTSDTIVSDAVRRSMPPPDLHDDAHLYRALRGKQDLGDEEIAMVKELEKTGFQHWSPYQSQDMATGMILRDFYRELGMDEWPYHNY